jgi:hypothetical protein
MEPAWSKPIPNDLVCGFYYVLFWVRAVVATVVLVTLLFTVMQKNKLPAGVFFSVLAIQIVLIGVAVTDSLFTYLVCERTIGGKPKQKIE